ncbi:hypothetical protein CASFOL_002490 [Castilleja foliolosa]|uniref:Transmembrane protein n=1 Tax=Castilleja foliolosa TaxID=1961234 RepID=A0ABD3EHY1_9LAMI
MAQNYAFKSVVIIMIIFTMCVMISSGTSHLLSEKEQDHSRNMITRKLGQTNKNNGTNQHHNMNTTKPKHPPPPPRLPSAKAP